MPPQRAEPFLIIIEIVWGRYSSGQRGQTVNLLTYVFTGSNPVLPTGEFKIGSSKFKICFINFESGI